jgi:hypothetical protein
MLLLILFLIYNEYTRKKVVNLKERQIQGTMCKNMYKQNLISAGEYATIEVGFRNASQSKDPIQRTLIDMYWKNAYKFTRYKQNLELAVPRVKEVVKKIRNNPSYNLTDDYLQMIKEVYGMRKITQILDTNRSYMQAWYSWEKK